MTRARLSLAGIASGVVLVTLLAWSTGRLPGWATFSSSPDLAECPFVPPALPMSTTADWVSFVVFNGTTYNLLDWRGPAPVEVRRDRRFGKVQRRTAETNIVRDFVDCDASRLFVDTMLYAVDGYDTRFRIATLDGDVFQASDSKIAKTGADIYAFAGKTVRIEVSWYGGQTSRVRGEITDAATIRRVEDAITNAAFEPYRPDDDRYSFRMVFADGTSFGGSLDSKTGYMSGHLRLPDEIIALLVSVAPAGEVEDGPGG